MNAAPVAKATLMGTYAQFKVMSDSGAVIATANAGDRVEVVDAAGRVIMSGRF